MVRAGRVFLDEIVLDPNPVTPGGIIEITLMLHEQAEIVFSNLCDPPGVQNQGIRTSVFLETEWFRTQTEQVCVPVFISGVGESQVTFRMDAPTLPEGTTQKNFNVSAYIEVGNQTSDRLVNYLNVTSEGAGQDEPQEPKDEGDSDLVKWIVQNPAKAAILGVGGIVVLNTATQEIV